MLITKVKADQLQARKDRNKIVTSLLTTLIGEADTIAKNKGRDGLDDASLIALIQKFINNINIVVDKTGITDSLKTELDTLNSYLPTKLSENQLKTIIGTLVSDIKGNPVIQPKQVMGEVLKQLKDGYAGQYDGKQASELVRAML